MGGEFRSKGLELFERLLVLSVYDAQIALQRSTTARCRFPDCKCGGEYDVTSKVEGCVV